MAALGAMVPWCHSGVMNLLLKDLASDHYLPHALDIPLGGIASGSEPSTGDRHREGRDEELHQTLHLSTLCVLTDVGPGPALRPWRGTLADTRSLLLRGCQSRCGE